MPYEVALILKQNRTELDQHEKSKEHLIHAENAYKEIASLYNFKTIECSSGNEPKSIEEISNTVYNYVINQL